MALTGACTGTPRRQRFRRYDASLLPVFALSGAIPNAACQASSKARPYAAYRRLQWVFRVRRHFRRYSSYSPVLAFCQAQSQMWLAKFLPRCGHIPFAGVCTGIPRPAAFSSVKRAPVFALSGGSRVQLAELFQRHGCMPLTGACTGTPRRQRFRRYDASLLPVFALSGAIPNAACQASSKARPYAAYRRLQWVFRVRRHFRRYSSYSPVLAFCQAQSQMWLAKFLPRCGRIPFAGVCAGIPRRQRFRRHSAPRSRPFLVPGKTPYRAGLPFSHIAAAWLALAAACFMKAPKSADGSAMRQPYRQKATFALFPTWDLQKWRWQRLCQMRMAVAANKKTASTLCCEGNSDGHCRPPGSRRNGRFPVHALPALPNRSSFSVTARFMASRARQTPSV